MSSAPSKHSIDDWNKLVRRAKAADARVIELEAEVLALRAQNKELEATLALRNRPVATVEKVAESTHAFRSFGAYGAHGGMSNGVF